MSKWKNHKSYEKILQYQESMHGDVHEGDFSFPEESVTEPADLVGEESQVASRDCSCAISRGDMDMAEGVEVETPVDNKQTPPPVEAVCRVDRE